MKLQLEYMATKVEEYDGKKGHIKESVMKCIDPDGTLEMWFSVVPENETLPPLKRGDQITVAVRRLLMMQSGSMKVFGTITK